MERKAIELNPNNYRPMRILERRIPGAEPIATRPCRPTARQSSLRKRTTQNGSDPGQVATLADDYAAVGDASKSLVLARQALALDPNDPTVNYKTGEAFETVRAAGSGDSAHREGSRKWLQRLRIRAQPGTRCSSQRSRIRGGAQERESKKAVDGAAVPLWCGYSYRNATIGSTRVARRAGMKIAKNAAATSSKDAPPIASGSVARTWPRGAGQRRPPAALSATAVPMGIEGSLPLGTVEELDCTMLEFRLSPSEPVAAAVRRRG